MTYPVYTVRESEVVSVFIDMVLEKGISGMPVVDDENRLKGIVTRTDLLAFELQRELYSIYREGSETVFKKLLQKDVMGERGVFDVENVRSMTVGDIMVGDVFTTGVSAPVNEICKIMKEKKINHVVIVEDVEIKGIVTGRDIIGLVADKGCG